MNSARVRWVIKVCRAKIARQDTTRANRDCTWDFASHATATVTPTNATPKLESAETAATTPTVTTASCACQDSVETPRLVPACHPTARPDVKTAALKEQQVAIHAEELATASQTWLDFVAMSVARELSDSQKPTTTDAANASALEPARLAVPAFTSAKKFRSSFWTNSTISL